MDAPALLIATTFQRLELLEAALREAGWSVRAAPNPNQALELLRAGGLGAVFCDGQLRGASPGGFLTWTRRLAPELPFYLIGEPGDLRGTNHQPTAILPYPPTALDLPGPRGTGTTPVTASPSTDLPLAGNTELVPLSDLLELFGLASRDAVMEFGAGRGKVFLEGGSLRHAEARSQQGVTTGLPGLAELLASPAIDFRVLPYRPPERATINLPVTAALGEAARYLDERRRDQTAVRRVLSRFPTARAVAAGYYLAGEPLAGHGEAEELFVTARKLLARNREHGTGAVRALSLDAADGAYALCIFGEDRLLAALGPAGSAAPLLAEVERAARAAATDEPSG